MNMLHKKILVILTSAFAFSLCGVVAGSMFDIRGACGHQIMDLEGTVDPPTKYQPKHIWAGLAGTWRCNRISPKQQYGCKYCVTQRCQVRVYPTWPVPEDPDLQDDYILCWPGEEPFQAMYRQRSDWPFYSHYFPTVNQLSMECGDLEFIGMPTDLDPLEITGNFSPFGKWRVDLRPEVVERANLSGVVVRFEYQGKIWFCECGGTGPNDYTTPTTTPDITENDISDAYAFYN